MDPFDMFSLVLDRHTSKILDLTSERPFYAAELSELLNIPLAACYRRIRMLKEAGLIREETKVQSEGGKSVSAYKSTIESAEIILRDGRLSIQMTVDGEDSKDEIDYSAEASMLWWQQTSKKED
jgi:predicted transcriptional regulator